MDKEELIQNYIANRLSDEEKAKVETLLETDVEMQALYETHAELATAFQLSKSNEIKKRLRAIDVAETSSKTKGFFQSKFSKIAIAAVFIIGVFFTINLLQSNGDLFESYFEVCPNTYLPIARGTTSNDLQFEAFKAYERNDFETSETVFKDVLKTTSNPTIKFYYAMSLLNQGKFDKALAQLNTLTNVSFDYRIESLWYAALIQIKHKNTEKAKEHLTVIQQLNKDFKSKEIQSIFTTFDLRK